jgi:hypothetical protein
MPETALPMDDNRDGIALTGETVTLPEYIKGTPPSIETLRKRFDEARSDANGCRVKSQTARDYYDGPKQLSSEIRTILRNRAQPPIYTNRVRPAINGLLGVLEQGRSDPQAYPRNPQDQDSADVVTKVLRFIADQSDFADTKQDVAENFFIEGVGAVLVEMDGDDITATQIRWEEFYFDPYSRRHDFLDARYMGVAKWVDAEMVKARWDIRIQELGDPLRPEGNSIFSDTFDDRGDTGAGWTNIKRRRVLLVEEYAIVEGEWKRVVYIASGVLEYGPSPYLDGKQRPCNPIEAVSCYVDRGNGRYGVVDDMIPLQDEINASRSRSLHLMNSRQVQNTDPSAPPVDSETVRQEAAKADGVMPVGWQILPTSDMTQANMLRNQEAKGEIERMGPTPAVLGRQEGASQSGRARLVSQQAGLTEMARPIGRLGNWELRVYRQFWNRARQFKQDPWFIRVTDDARSPEFLTVNEVVGQQPTIVPVPDPATGQITPQVIMQPIQKNRLAEMDVDIILDTVQDTATLAQEVWAELVQLVGQAGGLEAVYTPAFELMIEASPMADKTRVIELIKKGREEQQQNQVQQLTQQLQQMQQALEQKRQIDVSEVAANVRHKDAQSLLAQAKTDQTRVETEKSALDALIPNHLQDTTAV